MDKEQFIKSLSEKFNTKITNLSYSLLYFDSDGILINHGVYVFSDSENLFFLETEYKPKVFGFNIKTKPQTEFFSYKVDLNNIVDFYTVYKSSAKQYIRRKKNKLNRSNKFFEIFRETLVYIKLKDKEVFIDLPLNVFKNLINNN